MTRARLSHAELWGGPEDGEYVWVPQLLPELIGIHRMADGALIPIRDQHQLHIERPHITLYQHDPTADEGRIRPLYRHIHRPPDQMVDEA